MKVIAALLAIGFLAVGCSLLVWGLKSLIRRVKRRKYMSVTTGTVLRLETKTVMTSSSGEREESASRSKSYNFPVIEFLTDAGQKRTFKSTTGIPAIGKFNLSPGSKIQIVYDRENSEDAFVNDRFSRYGFFVSLFIAGMIGASAGFIILVLFVF